MPYFLVNLDTFQVEFTRCYDGKNFREDLGSLLFKHLDRNGGGEAQTINAVNVLIFGDIISQPAAPSRLYTEDMGATVLQPIVEAYLDKYRKTSTKKMHPVCFHFMLEQSSSGRQSC